MTTFIKGWYVVYTRPLHEKKVAQKLDHFGIEYFLPLIKNLRHWSDRCKYIDAPLFPSYIFVKLEESMSYFRSLEINGILNYIKMGKEMAVVPEKIICTLKHIVSSSSKDITVSSDYIAPGNQLIICEGPFAGFNCEMIRHNGKHKVLVRIDFIQRNVIADIAIDHLLPVKQSLTVSD